MASHRAFAGLDYQGRVQTPDTAPCEVEPWPDTVDMAADLERQAMLARQVCDCEERLADLDASRGVINGLLLSLALVGLAALVFHFLAA